MAELSWEEAQRITGSLYFEVRILTEENARLRAELARLKTPEKVAE